MGYHANALGSGTRVHAIPLTDQMTRGAPTLSNCLSHGLLLRRPVKLLQAVATRAMAHHLATQHLLRPKPIPIPVTKRATPASQQLAKQLEQRWGHHQDIQSWCRVHSVKSFVGIVSNPVGELWDIINNKRDYMKAVKECRHIDDLCQCPDWLGYYMDNETCTKVSSGSLTRKHVGELVMFSDLNPTNRHLFFMCAIIFCSTWLLSATSSSVICFMIPAMIPGGLIVFAFLPGKSTVVLQYHLEEERPRPVEDRQHSQVRSLDKKIHGRVLNLSHGESRRLADTMPEEDTIKLLQYCEYTVHRHLLHRQQRLQDLKTKLQMSLTCWEWSHQSRPCLSTRPASIGPVPGATGQGPTTNSWSGPHVLGGSSCTAPTPTQFNMNPLATHDPGEVKPPLGGVG